MYIQGIKNVTFLLCSAVLLLASCTETHDLVEVKDEEGNLLERFQVLKETYVKDGTYEAFYPSGAVLEEATYQNDTLQGTRTLYYENGQAQVVEEYDKGLFVGTFTAYHENGEVELRGSYEDNAMEGEWQAFYDNGQLKEVVQFTNNQENGPFIEYYANGNLKTEGNYLNGDTEDGLLKEYNEEGVLIRKALCENGICRTTWTLESGDVPLSE
jgi:antitoxin component YwqK of YwqJK toxin-antitoxin module